MRTTCRRRADDTRGRFRVRFHRRMTYVIRTSSAHLPELPNFMQYYTWCHPHVVCRHICHPHIVCMSSAHHPQVGTSSAHRLHIICRWVHCLHIICRYVCHPHIICRHICHPHIICRTPHGQLEPELSFYCDRNWLLNGICHNNVELFHFRIV